MIPEEDNLKSQAQLPILTEAAGSSPAKAWVFVYVHLCNLSIKNDKM